MKQTYNITLSHRQLKDKPPAHCLV